MTWIDYGRFLVGVILIHNVQLAFMPSVSLWPEVGIPYLNWQGADSMVLLHRAEFIWRTGCHG